MYVYRKFKEDGNWIYTVGFYSPDGKWNPESDHQDSEAAAQRVAWLNGGQSQEPLAGSWEDYKSRYGH